MKPISEKELRQIEKEVRKASKTSTEQDLELIIGSSLYLSSDNYKHEIVPLLESNRNFSFGNASGSLSDLPDISEAELQSRGRKYWRKFKKNLRETICNDSDIVKLMSGDGSLREYLKVGIPLILALLGMTALNPIATMIVIATFGIIIRSGFKTYCDVS